MVAQAFNSSTWETEAGRFFKLGQPVLQSEFQDSQGYTEKSRIEKQKQTQKQIKQRNKQK